MTRRTEASEKRTLAELNSAGPDDYIKPPHVAVATGFSQSCINDWRAVGKGPPFKKDERGHCLYRKADVLAWAKTNTPPRKAPMPTPKKAKLTTEQLVAEFNFARDTDSVPTPVAAAWLGLPAWTLEHWRYKHLGPPYSKGEKRIEYRKADIIAFRKLKDGPLGFADGSLGKANGDTSSGVTPADDGAPGLTRWSGVELEKIAVAAVKLRKNSKNMSPIDAVIAVQQFVLAEDRVRTAVQIRKTPSRQKIIDMMADIEKAERDAVENAKQAELRAVENAKQAELQARQAEIDAKQAEKPPQAELAFEAKPASEPQGVDIDAAHVERQWPFPPRTDQSELDWRREQGQRAAAAFERDFLQRMQPAPVPREHAVLDTPKPVEWDTNLLVQQAAMMLERVVVETAKRLLTNPDVAPLIRSFVLRQMPETHVEHAPPKHNPAPNSNEPRAGQGLPVVLVCGLQSHHYGTLQAGTQGRLNLRFWYDQGKGSRVNELSEKAKGVDWAVCAMGETSHTVIDILTKAGVRIERSQGLGASAVLGALNAIAARTAPPGAVAQAFAKAAATPHAPSGVQQAPRATVTQQTNPPV